MRELDVFTPLQADFFPFDEETYVVDDSDDDGIPLDGSELVEYEETIRAAVREHKKHTNGDLMRYFTGSPVVRKKVFSAIPDVAVRHGRLWGATHLTLKDDLNVLEMRELTDFITGQYAYGWGDSFEQQRIEIADGDLYVHFGGDFSHRLQILSAELCTQEQAPAMPTRPKLKLLGQDGNIFAILGRASRLLKECDQADKAQEMAERVCASGDYYRALHIISEYVETELSEPEKKSAAKDRSRSPRNKDGRER